MRWVAAAVLTVVTFALGGCATSAPTPGASTVHAVRALVEAEALSEQVRATLDEVARGLEWSQVATANTTACVKVRANDPDRVVSVTGTFVAPQLTDLQWQVALERVAKLAGENGFDRQASLPNEDGAEVAFLAGGDAFVDLANGPDGVAVKVFTGCRLVDSHE